MSRHGGLIPIGNWAFITLVDPISPPSAAAEPSSRWRLVVEAPGYCPPGPKYLFHPTIYRHSRLPGEAKIGNLPLDLKKLGFPDCYINDKSHWKDASPSCYCCSPTIVRIGD